MVETDINVGLLLIQLLNFALMGVYWIITVKALLALWTAPLDGVDKARWGLVIVIVPVIGALFFMHRLEKRKNQATALNL